MRAKELLKEYHQKSKDEKCPHCGGPMFSETLMMEKKDACYYKVKSRYKVWPSAYASGALVKCRKKGASNWGNKSESVAEAFGPLPRDNQQIRLGRHTVNIERVGEDKNYIGFAWHDSKGQEHYEEVSVGDLGSYDDLIDRIKQEISYQERQYTDQGVAEGKITLSTDPNWYGAEVGDYTASGPVVNIPANRLVGFEPDDKMNQPKSKANVEKIVAGLKQGAKLPPLLVRKYKNGYQVLDGHHRFWAYKLLGVKSIPAQIVPDSDIKEKSRQGVAEGLNESLLSSLVSQDQAERNEYKNFVKSQAGGDWSKGAKMYAQLKKRPSDDIFGDTARLNQFMKMKFDFDKFTDEDWGNYWLLAQHCDDNRDFQKNALSIIKKYQGTDHSHYKYLYDRISMGLTGKQKYGTQNVKEQGVAEGSLNEFDKGKGGFGLSSPRNFDLTPEYNALFNAIGTQRSSRSGEIKRPYEFLYEIFAQYLGTGQVTFNALPTNLGYGRKAWGTPSKYLNIKPEFRDESDRKQISDMLAGDMELMFNDVLSSSVGNIYVM